MPCIALPRPVRLFWICSAFLVILCIGFELFCHFGLHKHYPYDWPLIPFYRFNDFMCFKLRFQHFHRLDVFSPDLSVRFMYPAPVSLLYEGFYMLGTHSLIKFLVLTAGLVLVLAVSFGRAMVHEGIRPWIAATFVGSSILLSYPLWFEYSLGNMEICIFLIVASGLLAFLHRWYYLAAFLIGVAVSMKIFPLVYLALFFSCKRYREMAFAVLVALSLNLVSLWLLCPSLSVSYRGIEDGLAAFRRGYMLRILPVETGFDHSAFALIKSLGRGVWTHSYVPSRILTAYLIVAVLAGLALYFIRIRKLPMLNQIVCLSIASILLPPTSHDYTLLHLYVPLGLLILYTIRRSKSGPAESLVAPMVCFAILVSPESELVYHVGISGQLKAVTLIVLLWIALTQRWEERGWQAAPAPLLAS